MAEEFTNSLVVFADILGTGASTTNVERSRIFLEALIQSEAKVTSRLEYARSRSKTVHYRWFSDNFSIISPNLDTLTVKIMLEVAAQAQLEFWYRGLFLRGAFSYGGMYHSDNLDYGPALNEAGGAEKVMVRMPRIVLLPSLTEAIHLAHPEVDEWISIDPLDGKPFVNVFRCLPPEGRQQIRRSIVEGRNNTGPREADKYDWLVSYYNRSSGSSRKIPPQRKLRKRETEPSQAVLGEIA